MKYCDLVMKGGITSGIVYPNAVLALSRDYRFKNIGGTSAGAIAAAASAAAAYGDRCKVAGKALSRAPAEVGFEGLEIVAKRLAQQGFIYDLFQPARGAASAYRLLVTLTGKAGWLRKLTAVALAVFTVAPLETILFLMVLLGIAYAAAGTSGLAAAAIPSIVCAYLGAAIAAVFRVARVTRSNLLGLCSGLPQKRWFGKSKPALTQWLHEVLQTLSGKNIDDPLTFEDLWSAPAYEGEPRTAKALTLQMITTSVSHHEPRTLPFSNGRFWFRKDQFERLFPPEIVNWLVARSDAPISIGGKQYFRLVDGGKLPVLIGMRMSLSFPLLISAIPLYEPSEWSDRGEVGQSPSSAAAEDAAGVERTILESVESLAAGGRHRDADIAGYRVCWFSDGGISSNFPVHLFDAPLPVWPTFAINLVYHDAAESDPPAAIALPSGNNVGWQRSYQSIDNPVAFREIAGFLFNIIGTMQNWRDLLLARAPGQRDRIVAVPLAGDEGGMNLDMPQPVLDHISAKGTQAGEAFRAFSFSNHYWIRWRNLASALQRYTIKIGENAHSSPPIDEYADAYQTARSGVPPPPSYRFGSKHRSEGAQDLLECLVDKGREWDERGPNLTDGAPRPLPQMQISPIF